MRQQVNLLTPELIPVPERLPLRQLLLLWGACCGLLLAVSAVAGWQLGRLEEQAATLEADWHQARAGNEKLQAAQRKEPDALLVAQLDDLERRYEQRQRLLRLLSESAPEPGRGFADVMRDLARHPGDGLWLDRIRIDRNGGNFALNGVSRDPDRLPPWLQALSGAPSVAGRRFEHLHVERDETGHAVFEVAARAGAIP